MAQGVVDRLEPVQVEIKHRQSFACPACHGQGRREPVVQQSAVGQPGQLVVLRHMLQSGLHPLTFYGGGDLGGDELKQRLVFLVVAGAVRIALEQQHADGAVMRFERNPQQAKRPRADPHARLIGHACFLRQQERLPALQDPRVQRSGQWCAGAGRGVVSVRVIGKVQQSCFLIVKRDRKIVCRKQSADDLVDALDQREQVADPVRRFGDRIEGSLNQLGALAFGDVPRHADPHLIGGRPACRPHEVDDASILADIAIFEVKLRVAGHDHVDRLPGPFAVFRHHEVEHVHADHLVRSVSEDAFACRAGEHHARIDIDREHRVHEQVDEVGVGRVGFFPHERDGHGSRRRP